MICELCGEKIQRCQVSFGPRRHALCHEQKYGKELTSLSDAELMEKAKGHARDAERIWAGRENNPHYPENGSDDPE